MSQAKNLQFHHDVHPLKPWLFLAMHCLPLCPLIIFDPTIDPRMSDILLFGQNMGGSAEHDDIVDRDHDDIVDRDSEFKMAALASLCNIG
jgi:hypothetical protein